MMTFNLVKKDILIIKNYVLIMMMAVVGIPLFVAWRVPIFLGFATLFLAVLYTQIILGQAISVEEAKYPRAAALLCAVSYSRSAYVKAKYAFFLMIFAYCLASYAILAALIPQISTISLTSILSVLLINSLIFGINMPLQFKFGVEKTKFAFSLLIFVASFGMPLFYTYFNPVLSYLPTLVVIPEPVKHLLLTGASVAVLAISLAVSIRIYSKKEL